MDVTGSAVEREREMFYLMTHSTHFITVMSKDGFYLMMHSTHFIYGYMERERNVLFNDAFNTFYLRLYGVRHMVKDHSNSEKGNPLLPHRLLLSINSKDNTYHGLYYTSCGALAGTRNSSMGPPHEGSIDKMS